jgi:5-(carboxyamino)imidazole ribonucleotide mutase
MGSQSDWPTMREAAASSTSWAWPYETRIVSAHRTPDRLWDYGKTAVDRGLKVIIAGAGGAAHLPGMMASKTRVPVIGVPVRPRRSRASTLFIPSCRCHAAIPSRPWP